MFLKIKRSYLKDTHTEEREEREERGEGKGRQTIKPNYALDMVLCL